MFKILFSLMLFVCGLHAQKPSTIVSADSKGTFWRMPVDSLIVSTLTYWHVPVALAPAEEPCVYSGRSQRANLADSTYIIIRNSKKLLYELTLRPKDTFLVDSNFVVNKTWIFTIIDISMPRDPCGVNEGQVWFHWELHGPDKIM